MNHNIITEISMQPSPGRLVGSKRSRDEASINLEPEFHTALAVDPPKDSTHGVGKVVIHPANSHVVNASTQSCTLMQRSSDEHQRAEHDLQTHQPVSRNHKTQRLDRTTHKTPLRSTMYQPASLFLPENVSSANAHDALVIDNFTVHLGIGWRRISGDEHIQAAARGWARFIENNFGLEKVRICLESKGLQSYLIEASSGYFLFAEDLRQGRLVSPTAEGALINLQLSPPIFEGPELEFMAPPKNNCIDMSADSTMVLDP
ncbi:hypothetical protein E4U19_007773 [Claviceps sp. Clav32 group G5]|nr:hypothetical protein E4U40_007958 [Claviceps sp. LM458 group G5]KAG6018924.1 hypothetical protein E4U19_007773 [Claviceps sp. Clav32 group G5]KAG6040462.1 hypothetical protein E4U39_007126 [Claviceps sp. Clav50 group G5]